MSSTMPLINKNIVLATDLEPDDFMAIYVLLMKNHTISVILLSEADAISHKKTPGEFMKELVTFLDCAQRDNLLKTYPTIYMTNGREYDQGMHQFVEFLNMNPTHSVLWIKPITELMYIPDGSLNALSRSEFAFYGGFNFRKTVNLLGNSQRVRDVLDKMGRIIVFENFLAFGKTNSITMSSHPKIYENMSKFVNTYGFISANITEWNTHILTKMEMNRDKLKQKPSLTDKESEELKRAENVITSVKRDVSSQILLADQALMCLLCDNVIPNKFGFSYVSFDSNGYTNFNSTPTPDTNRCNVFTWEKLEPRVIIDILEQMTEPMNMS